jgi:alpha-galactosidase
LLLLAVTSLASDNGLGLKPQMGWNSWNAYGCDVNETKIMEAADALVALGLDKLGYTYVNIDDCWNTDARDENSNMIVNATSFPKGMKSLADDIHAKNLMFGIYSDAGI